MTKVQNFGHPIFCFMKKNSLLWSVQHPDLLQPSYWFGTMHMCPKTIFEQKLSKISSYIESSNAIAVEFDINQVNVLDDIIYLPNDGLLRDYISEKAYEKVQRRIHRFYGLDLNLYQRFRPSILSSNITELLMESPVQMEGLIMDTFSHKIIYGLEKYDDYANIFEKFNIEYEFNQLKDQVLDLRSTKRKFYQLLRAYDSENIVSLYKMTKKGLGKYKNTLLKERNIQMVNTAAELMNNNSNFVCVGAAHLAGNWGCIALLKRAGYKVTAI